MATIKKLSEKKGLFKSRLDLNITGKEIDYVVINTLRRIILSDIPVYVYDDIEISENTSVFNNNQIKLYLQNIPVIGINPDDIPLTYKKKTEDTEEALEDEELDTILEQNEGEFYSETEPIKTDSLNQLTMFLDYENTSSEIKTVTTNEAKFYLMGKEIKSPYPNPNILIKLQPKQKIRLSAKTRLSSEKEDGKFSAVSICAFNELKEDSFKFFLESRGLYTEKEILIRACRILLRKFKKLDKMLSDVKMKDGEIKIPKGTHTIGNLLSQGLSLLKETKYATYYQKHILDDEVIIKFGFEKEENLKNMINKVIKYYSNIFEDLKKGFKKL